MGEHLNAGLTGEGRLYTMHKHSHDSAEHLPTDHQLQALTPLHPQQHFT